MSVLNPIILRRIKNTVYLNFKNSPIIPSTNKLMINCNFAEESVIDNVKEKVKELNIMIKGINSQTDLSDIQQEVNQLAVLFDPQIVHIGSLGKIIKIEDKYYLSGSTIPIPKAFINLLNANELNDDNYQALIDFWKNLLLNPDEELINRIIGFVENENIRITTGGYMLFYKSVMPLTDTILSKQEEFVFSEVTRIKIAKKSLKNYYIRDREVITKAAYEKLNSVDQSEFVTLDERYKTLIDTKETITYTDWFEGSTIIRIGHESTLPRHECNNNSNICAAGGLHVGEQSYVAYWGKSNKAILLCLVHPMDIVAVPFREKVKVRTCRFIPVSVVDHNEFIKDRNIFDYLNLDLSDVIDYFTITKVEERLNDWRELLTTKYNLSKRAIAEKYELVRSMKVEKLTTGN